MVTSTMWEYALNKQIERGRPTGCIVDHSASPPRVRALVASYYNSIQLNGGDGLDGYTCDEEHVVLIPLDDDGQPVWPFAYHGKERELGKVWSDVPSEQKNAIVGWEFKAADFEAAKAAVHSKDYVALANAVGINMDQKWPDEEGYVVLSWFRASDGKLEESSGAYLIPSKIPDTAHIVLLPPFPPRPPDVRNRAIAVAIVSTPLTVLKDTIYAPLNMMIWTFFPG